MRDFPTLGEHRITVHEVEYADVIGIIGSFEDANDMQTNEFLQYLRAGEIQSSPAAARWSALAKLAMALSPEPDDSFFEKGERVIQRA